MDLLKQYLALSWFRNNPAELDAPVSFLWKCLIFYLVSGIIVEANISDPADATLEVGMRAIVAFSLLTTLLFLTKKSDMYKQLLIAVFVCENVIVTLGILVEILDHFLRKTPYEELPLYLGAILIVWYLAIISYILRHMFNSKMFSSIGLSVFYFAMTYGGPFLFMEVI